MSKEEVERQEQSADHPRRSSSVEKTMQAAEKRAAKEGHTVHPRILSTVRAPQSESGEPTAPTLPIVEEAGESSSTGEQSQHGEHWPLPSAEKDLPPLPNENSSHEPSNEKGKERVSHLNDPKRVSVR